MTHAAAILRQRGSALQAWRSRIETGGFTLAALFCLAAVGLLTAISFTIVSDVLGGSW